MATEPTLEERIQAWGESVVAEFDQETTETIAEVEALGISEERAMMAMDWAQDAPEETLLFTLAVCVSEVIGRWGLDATQEVLENLLDTPAIQAFGGVVHARRIVDLGGTPDEFLREDLETAINTAEDENYTREEL